MRIKDIGKKVDVKNIGDLVDKEIKSKFETDHLTKQQIRKYKRHGSEFLLWVKKLCIVINAL